MAATVSYQATDVDVTGSNTVTFPLTVASAAGQERIVALGLIVATSPATFSIDSVTIDGQAATQVLAVSGANDGAGARAEVRVYRAPGTSGTSINVVMNVNAVNADCFGAQCSLWTLSNADTGTTATASSTADDPTLSLNTVNNGAVIACGFRYSATATSTWTGLTERVDTQSMFGDTVWTVADANITTGETPRTVSIAWSAAMTLSGGAISVSFTPVGIATTDGAGTASAISAASAVGSALAMLAPDADITDGSWLTDTGGTSLFAAIDESPASDTDYIVSGSPDTDMCEIRLSDPGMTVARPFSVAYRYKRIGTDTPTLRVQLMEGATSRASWDVAVSSSTFTDGEQFLTAPEFAAIVDFTDLRVRLTAIRESALGLEGDFSGDLTLEGDFSGSLLLEGS